MHKITFVLLIIGGLNWLLVGVFGWDVSRLWGDMASVTSRVIYVLVGLSAIYEAVTHKSLCRNCNPEGTM